MPYDNYSVATAETTVLSSNKVLRNTYFLLSLTMLFSAFVTIVAMVTRAPYPGAVISILGMFGLLFLTQILRNSAWGLLATFAFTGFMGYTLAPMLNLYLQSFSNGGELIITALGGTGVIFLSLSDH